MAFLRKIKYCVNGVQPAWEETFMNWNSVCKNLASYPKAKTEEGQMEPFHRAVGKRRASHQNSEHELEDQINEWANMTGFLCALGGVCLQKKSPCLYPSASTVTISSIGSAGTADTRKATPTPGSSSSVPQEQRHYCPVTQ